MGKTAIPYVDETWNSITGCAAISEGCRHCWAKAVTERFGGDFSQVTLHLDRLEQPLHWKKPRRIFVNSMSDLFHKDVPDEFIDRIYETMLEASQHTYLLLTKRPERMLVCVRRWLGYDSLPGGILTEKMLEKIWLGISIENQQSADERTQWLLKTPAVVRWLSVEPLLEPVNLRRYLIGHEDHGTPFDGAKTVGGCVAWTPSLDWIVVGGESGPYHRPCEVSWITDIVEQCKAAGTACYIKQDSHRLPGQQGRIPDDLWRIKEIPI